MYYKCTLQSSSLQINAIFIEYLHFNLFEPVCIVFSKPCMFCQSKEYSF